jgi:hypothetical protein
MIIILSFLSRQKLSSKGLGHAEGSVCPVRPSARLSAYPSFSLIRPISPIRPSDPSV